MSSLPKLLLAGGFLAGFLVLCGADWVISPSESVKLDEFFFRFAIYTAVIGGALLIPWVLLPVISNKPGQSTRVIFAGFAGLLPTAVAIGGVICLFSGLDAPPTVEAAFSLSIAVWFIPAIGALAYMVAYRPILPTALAKKPNLRVVTTVCVGATLTVVIFSGFILTVAGWVTRTESPNTRHVAHAREFLLINPGLDIEPLAYYEKDGMDYMVRFKFIAKTNDPNQIFDQSHVDPTKFEANFNFPPGEVMHNEMWWDISSRPMSGGYVRVPHDRTLTIGYFKNTSGTFTVYVWRHEGQFPAS